MSLMEAVARVAGEPHSYRPKCASPVIGDFLDTLEFCSNAEERQKLKRFIPKLIGTAASDAVGATPVMDGARLDRAGARSGSQTSTRTRTRWKRWPRSTAS